MGGSESVCVNAPRREGGGRGSKLVQCAHFAEELWVKVTFALCKAGLQ